MNGKKKVVANQIKIDNLSAIVPQSDDWGVESFGCMKIALKEEFYVLSISEKSPKYPRIAGVAEKFALW